MESVLFTKLESKHSKSYYLKASLNAPKALNALSLEMIDLLYEKLLEEKNKEESLGVLLCGEGRAFCAGGDIVALYENAPHNVGYFKNFFEKEYRLDHLIHRYPKPVIAYGNGIVMGGGMGLMQGAHYKIVNETSMLAMPEISIGLYPDVGASHFLKRKPELGKFIALSACRMNAQEALEAGLADTIFHSEHYAEFESKIAEAGNKEDLEKLISEITEKDSPSLKSKFITEKTFINDFLKNSSVLELSQWAKSYEAQNKWQERVLKNIQNASINSLAIIFQQWEKAKNLSLEEAFQMEWNLSVNCCLGNDLKEGIRALLIDKDKNPQWKPARAEELNSELLLKHFELPPQTTQNALENLCADLKGLES